MQSILLEVEDIKGNLDEAKEQAAHRLAGEIERVQDSTELLFSSWSETLKQEIEQRQDKLIQHVEGKSLASELQMQDVEKLSQALATHHDQQEDLQKEIAFLKVDIDPQSLPVQWLPYGHTAYTPTWETMLQRLRSVLYDVCHSICQPTFISRKSVSLCPPQQCHLETDKTLLSV